VCCGEGESSTWAWWGLLGLGIILNLYRLKGTVDLDAFQSLQG
jgi:NADH:ubiquinone oxidoreductase subunit K